MSNCKVYTVIDFELKIQIFLETFSKYTYSRNFFYLNSDIFLRSKS